MTGEILPQEFGGTWSLIKLDVLHDYLRFFTTALKNQRFRLVYIDAFAGSGAMLIDGGPGPLFDPEASSIHRGSASLALAVEPPFDSFQFVERSAVNVQSLRALAQGRPDVAIWQDDANTRLREICATFDRRSFRGVVFLDPFALSVEWETLKSIAATGALDVWYLFPTTATVRLLALDAEKVTAGNAARVSQLLGTDDWRTEFYPEPPVQTTLFGNEPGQRRRLADVVAIEAFVKRRLESIFSAVSEPARLGRSQNQTLFSLFFAVSNPNKRAIELAMRGAQHILRNRRRASRPRSGR